MTNYGGGVLIYDVTDNNSHAGSRLDVSKVDDNSIQVYQLVAYNHVTPQLHNVELISFGSGDGSRALVLAVPASHQMPHMLIDKDREFHFRLATVRTPTGFSSRKLSVSTTSHSPYPRAASEA